ncbi:MAG: sulfotransferase [Methylophilaceae bacterium]
MLTSEPAALSPIEAHILAESHKFAGRLPEAENLLRQILASAPQFHPAYHTLGLIAYEVGKLPLAVELISKAITLNPNVGFYQRNAGEMCRRLERLDEAVQFGQRATELSPDDLDAHYNLGLALTDQCAWQASITAYRRALALNPKHGLSWNNLGAALEKQGDLDAAEAAYSKAIALNPKHSEAQTNLGAMYSEQGRLEEACRCFEAAIKAAPDFIEPHYNLSSLKTYTETDPHLLMLERNLGQAQALPLKARIRYWFALGKAREDVGRFDEAFAAYEQGNRMQHEILPCDEERADEVLREVIKVFSKEFFAERKNVKGSTAAPIFIVGMPRSGTTLLEQILSSHPAVHGAGELMDLHEVVLSAGNNNQRFPNFVTNIKPEDFAKLGEQYAKRVWKLAPDAERITDKMPANFFYLGMIHLMLPNAKIIHAMRDPMDSCFSCYSRLFNDTMEFAYNLGTLGRYYARYMQLMRHWHEVLPAGKILDLRYEEMVADTAGQARRILDFLELPWDDNCLAFHENKRHVKTASVAQVRKPIYKTSVEKWRRFEAHLQPLLRIVNEYRDKPAELPSVEKESCSSLEQALELASQHQSQGRLQEAEQLLQQILQAQPNNAFALHLLGVIAHQVGKPELAIDLIGKAINSNPNVGLFHANLGEMLRQQGKLDAAIQHGEQAVALDANMASAHSNLGVAYFDREDYDLAEACHEKALAIAPQFSPSLNNLGSIFRARKDVETALDWYRKAIAANPQYLEPLNNMGAVLMEEERHLEAQEPLLRALQINPNYAEAVCNLGLVKKELEQPDAALQLLQKALQLKPDYPEAYLGLARVAQDAEDLPQAEKYALRAIELAPEKPDGLSLLGTLYTEMGRGVEAIASYENALKLDPEHAEALLGLGNLNMENGDMAQAESLFNQALVLEPDNIGARFHLSQVKKVKAEDANFAALLEAAKDADSLPSKKAMSLHFALGKCFEDSGQPVQAFPHFLEGCRLKRATFEYSAEFDRNQFTELTRLMDKPAIERLRGAGNPSKTPIFVLGMPRSGTTLTEQIIASHPQVYGAGELPDLMEILQRDFEGNGAGFPQNLATLTADKLSIPATEYVSRLQQRAPDAKHITDKMPANFYAVGLIHLMLPNAKIIHVKRNPIDTCVSCFTRLFNRKQHQTYDLAELGQHYVSYAKLMEHWRQVLPTGAFLEVNYEDIVADKEAAARRLIAYCGLEWDDACLDFHNTKRAIRTASVTQVRQPIYTSSVERWRAYEQFLTPLLDALGK